MFKDRGMQTFVIIWFGQAVSLLGTAMTRFALPIWAYQQTGKATTLALLGFFSFIVYVPLGPLAGVWADRWDRRRVMIVADSGAALVTVGLLALYAAGHLHIWHLYAGEVLSGMFEAFQTPAYSASMSVLVPRGQLGRANGLRSLSYETTNILAPVGAGLLLVTIGLGGIMLIDIVTCSAAVSSLFVIRIPRPAISSEGRAAAGSGWRQEMTFGVRYIRERPGLISLAVVHSLILLYASMTYYGLMPAMILARTGGDELAVSSVQSMLGIGGIIGGIMLTVWGGPRRKIHGQLAFCAASFLMGDLWFAMGRTPFAWTLAGFAAAFWIPFIGSANTSIWQSKVPHDVQGKVLGAAFALQQATRPVGYLLAGPLADHFFEPGMVSGGALSGIFGGLTGTGPGAGIAVMFLFTAVMGTVTCLGGYLVPALRNVETDLPDVEHAPLGDVVLGAAAAD
jgi:DHA3 family macrolide efflux protein-like MFS transporter